MTKTHRWGNINKVKMDEVECLKDRLIASENIAAVNKPVDIILSLVGFASPAAEGIKVLKDVVVNKFDSFQNEKGNKFCNVILENKAMTTRDKVQDVTFIMEFLRTMDVVNRVSQNDKVAYIAQLFNKSFLVKDINEFDVDQYEEYLHRLDYLSLKEIHIMMRYYDYGRGHIEAHHREWYSFKTMIADEMLTTEDDIVSRFSGLCMTGFCRVYKTTFPGKSGREDPIFITDYFSQFIERIID